MSFTQDFLFLSLIGDRLPKFTKKQSKLVNVIQFCNGICSVVKVVVPTRKGKQEHVKAPIIYRKI